MTRRPYKGGLLIRKTKRLMLNRLMYGCKCGQSTRWKLSLHCPSVTKNCQPAGNRSSLLIESFVGPPCTCLTYKRASMQRHVRILKLVLTSWVQACIPPSSTLSPFVSIQSNVRNHKRRRAVHRSSRSAARRQPTHGN